MMFRRSVHAILAISITLILSFSGVMAPTIGSAHAAASVISKVQSGLVASDSLTTGDMSYWTFGGSAANERASYTYFEDSQGLHIGVKSNISGQWAGFYAVSPNTNAYLFHAFLTVPYATIPDNSFNTGLYVQTSNQNFINYVGCLAEVNSAGYHWIVVQAYGVALAALAINTLWSSPYNSLPQAQDCTIITNGNNYLKVYLGGNVIFSSNSMILYMPPPFNAYLEPQTNSATSMRFGMYNNYYSTLSEEITLTNAPAGGTVRIVDSSNNLLASAPVGSDGIATLLVGMDRLPLEAYIKAYDSNDNLVASTPGTVTLWGGDTYTASPGSTTTFGGRAFAMSVNTPLGTLTFADTGQLPPSGGEIDATPITLKNQFANAEVLPSVTMGFGSQGESTAGLADLVLLPGTANQITADFVMSKSFATCTSVTGFSDFANLQLAGQRIEVSGQPNQIVSVPGVLTLIINEQITTSNSITVNALHLLTATGTEVIVSSAYSAVSCMTVQQMPHDLVTGKGWIVVGGAKGTFGFVAGYKNDATSPGGKMAYIDHATGMNVKATSVTSYTGSGNVRTFGGDAVVNGVPGYTYTVTVTDNGHPGKNQDTFSIQISNGYSASGTIAGGEIKIHT